MTDRSCGSHAGIPDDLRATALQLLERVRAVVEPLADPGPDPGAGRDAAREPGPGACSACPVCALLAVLRGERSELAARLAEHTTGLLGVLVAALEEAGEQAPARPDRQQANGHPANGHPANGHSANGHRAHKRGRSVQRIVVHRA